MIPPPEIKELTIADYFHIVWKRIWIVIASVGIIGGFVSYKELSTPKVYQTQATIFIKRETPRIIGEGDVVYTGGLPTLQAQILLLKSYSVAERVLKDLNLLTP